VPISPVTPLPDVPVLVPYSPTFPVHPVPVPDNSTPPTVTLTCAPSPWIVIPAAPILANPAADIFADLTTFLDQSGVPDPIATPTCDYTPSTIEAQVYAAGGRTGPLQRTPKNRTPWTPEGIQAAKDARANHGASAASGSGAGPAPAAAPGTVRPGHRNPTPPAGSYPSRKTPTAGSIDIMAHLDNTPMKVTLGSFVKEAPGCCANLIKQLQSFSKSPTKVTDSRSLHPKRKHHHMRPLPLPVHSTYPVLWPTTDLCPWKLPLRQRLSTTMTQHRQRQCCGQDRR